MKILSVVGARPQFIKAFVVSNELRHAHEEVLVHTGQHYDDELSGAFFDALDIPEPDYNLGVGSGSHGEQTAAMLAQLERVIETETPDVVLLYGDTNSTLAGAIAAVKQEPAIAHVEAGLRGFNRDVPEEHNRVVTDHCADLLLAPSPAAVDCLEAEGLADRTVETGDVMYDALLEVRERATAESTVLRDRSIDRDGFVLSTIHRPRNTENRDRLESIVSALADVARQVVLPIHPRTESALKEWNLWSFATRELAVIPPVDYLDFVALLDAADRVATDSGGVQKEAFFLDTYCVTLRVETEWVETVEAGYNVLVDADREAIMDALRREWTAPAEKPEPYGDGEAARAVRVALERHLAVQHR